MTGQQSRLPRPQGHPGVPGVVGTPGAGWGLSQPTEVPVTVWEAGAVTACSLRVQCVLCVCCLCVTSSACPCGLLHTQCVLTAHTPCSLRGPGVTVVCSHLCCACHTRFAHSVHAHHALPAHSRGGFEPGVATALGLRLLFPGLPFPGLVPVELAVRECAQNHTRVCKGRQLAQGVFAPAHTHTCTQDHVLVLPAHVFIPVYHPCFPHRIRALPLPLTWWAQGPAKISPRCGATAGPLTGGSCCGDTHALGPSGKSTGLPNVFSGKHEF